MIRRRRPYLFGDVKAPGQIDLALSVLSNCMKRKLLVEDLLINRESGYITVKRGYKKQRGGPK